MPNFPEFEVPGGPPEQQPAANPALSESFARIAASVDKQAESAKRIEDVLKRIPTATEEITRQFRNVNIELEAMVQFADDTEAAIKLINSQTASLRRGIISTKKTKDALTVLNSIVSAQKQIQAQAKKGSQQWAGSSKIIQDLEGWMKKLQDRTGDLADDELKALNKTMLEAEKTGERMVKNFRAMTVNHVTRQVQGMTRALAAIGIGKDYAAKVEKYAKFAEVPYRMREAQRARLQESREAFRTKRESALAAVRERFGENMASPAAQALFQKTMGIRRGRLRAEELQHLMTGEGPKTAAVASMEEHGTGMVGQVLSKAAGGMEDAVGTFGEIIAELGPVIAAFEGAVAILVAAFDGFVKQNKEMEAGLAGGGLFAGRRPGMNFAYARAAMLPHGTVMGTGISSLGITYERNLKIAQTIAEEGGNIQDLIKGGRQMFETGYMPGGPQQAGREFMPGAIGKIQRATVGAGRLAGMTDVEGVRQVMKMLNQYRTTLSYSEDFFDQVRKATNAAGISTTKYISILDDMLSHFSRMNKNMQQAVNVLGDLSKTGRLASEDLKDYFDFLTGGAGAADKTGQPTQMFLYGQMSQRDREDALKNAKQMVQSTVSRAARDKTFAPLGVTSEALNKGMSGTVEQVNDFLDSVTRKLDLSKLSPAEKQPMNNMIEQLRQLRYGQGLSQRLVDRRISAVGMGYGMQALGPNMINSMIMQQQAMKVALRSTPGGMAGIMKQGVPLTAAQSPQFIAIAQALGESAEQLGESLRGTQLIAGELRVKGAATSELDAKRLFQDLQKTGFKMDLNGSRDYKKFFADHLNDQDLQKAVAELESTFSYYGEALTKQGEDMTDQQRKELLDKTRGVAEQTQSTADLISAAFSKWFMEIISDLEFMVDHWPHWPHWLGGADIKPLAKDDMTALGEAIQKTNKDIAGKREDMYKARAAHDYKTADQLDKQIKILQEQKAKFQALQDQGETRDKAGRYILASARELATGQKTKFTYGTGDIIKAGIKAALTGGEFGLGSVLPSKEIVGPGPTVPLGGPTTAAGLKAVGSRADRFLSGGNISVTNNNHQVNVNSPTTQTEGTNQSNESQPLNSGRQLVGSNQ